MSKSGIVNVRMVITEEKILSNIEKVQRLINPKSKKQIVQLEDDSYFKDLIESIKTYLIEYPKKKNFPISVYKAAYELVEFATNQFEENTKRIEELIRQREQNIAAAGQLKELLEGVQNKDKDWKDKVKKAEDVFSEDIIETLTIVGKSKEETSENPARLYGTEISLTHLQKTDGCLIYVTTRRMRFTAHLISMTKRLLYRRLRDMRTPSLCSGQDLKTAS